MDVVLESPLVRHLTGSAEGVAHGKEHLREFVRIVFERTPPIRRRYRAGYFTDGWTIMWEYPREAPDGDQMDFAEGMEIDNGLIQRQRVYWGWFGVKTLEENRYGMTRRSPVFSIEARDQSPRASAIGVVFSAEMREEQRLFGADARDENRDHQRGEQHADN
jgi:hypothetical protein